MGLASNPMWLPNGDLACDTCGATFTWSLASLRLVVANAARTRGWHLYQGASLTGKNLDSHLCPSCVGGNHTVKKKLEPLDDEPLF